MKIQDAIHHIVKKVETSGYEMKKFTGCAINITKSNKKSLTVWLAYDSKQKLLIPIDTDNWEFIGELCDTLVSLYGNENKEKGI